MSGTICECWDVKWYLSGLKRGEKTRVGVNIRTTFTDIHGDVHRGGCAGCEHCEHCFLSFRKRRKGKEVGGYKGMGIYVHNVHTDQIRTLCWLWIYPIDKNRDNKK